jgi:hypothetical protein
MKSRLVERELVDLRENASLEHDDARPAAERAIGTGR